uniref:Integrase catalytic domain-containing protein n=1 Tax=Strongyloides papillosus TaxID=174720 RepID=A0A0N5B1U5_STREA
MENCRNRNQIIIPWPIPIMARERVHGDIFFFESRTFLVLTCAYSNFVAIYHLNSIFTSELVKKIDWYINIYSLIRILITDGGTQFRSEEFQNSMIDRNIIHRLSIAYRSCSNDIVEKSIQTIKQILKKARSDGMSLQNSLILAADAVNNLLKGENTTARQLFLNKPSLDVDIVLKYCPYETPFKKYCWFNYDKTSPWRESKVISKISKSLFKIKFEDKFHIRTIDSIKFKKSEKEELASLPEKINSNNDVLGDNVLNDDDLKKDDLNINDSKNDLPMDDDPKDDDSNDDALSIGALSDISKSSTKTATDMMIEKNNKGLIASQKDVLK